MSTPAALATSLMVTFDFRMQTAYSTATSHLRNGSRNLSAVWFFPPKRGWPHANVCIQLQSLDLARATSPRILLASAVFSRFWYRQSPFVGSVWLDIPTLSNGRLHPFGGEGSVPHAAFTLSGVKGAC